MPKFLLTGGSGFIASHVLDQLLEQGHTVVTTVRSEAKAAPIRSKYADVVSDGRLHIILVPDISVDGAFEEAAKSPGIDYVLHTASPFHFQWDDPKTSLLDPAINGTVGILHSIHAHSPTTKRVVVTSSFAAITQPDRITDPTMTFDESSWNKVTVEEATAENKMQAYRASKTFAERAAWDFMKEHEPSFDLATVCPPLVYGPAANRVTSLDQIALSNQGIVSLLRGAWKDDMPPMRLFFWVDVRDVATAHIKAALVPEAGGKRFFCVAGYFSHAEMVEAVRKNFPALEDKLPPPGLGQLPPKDKICRYDNSRASTVLGIDWIRLEKSMVDMVTNFNKIEPLGI